MTAKQIMFKKKRTYSQVDFTVPANHRMKTKESEKINKYLQLVRELKKLGNMRVSVSIYLSIYLSK